MLIPRSWTFAQRQRSPEQTLESAKPAAVDARFKAASILAVVCVGLIVFRLVSASRAYRSNIPPILSSITVVTAIRLAYAVAGSWVWSLSPYRLELNIGLLYGLAYAPAILILFLLNVRGYLCENEDKILIAQRSLPGDEPSQRFQIPLRELKDRRRVTRERPPSWWLRTRNSTGSPGDPFKIPPSSKLSPSQTDSAASSSKLVEQDESGHYWWQQRRQEEDDARFRKSRQSANKTRIVRGSQAPESENTGVASGRSERDGSPPRPPPRYERETHDPTEGNLSHQVYGRGNESMTASSTNSLQSAPQVVRSMLDV